MKNDEKLIRVADFSSEEMKAWQGKLLEILVYFQEFCDKHHLRFWLSYGTLIGALRHNGFVPWDDDIDVQMPREDYDKLYELWKLDADNTKFSCCKTTKGHCIHFPQTHIRHNGTTCIYEHSKDFDENQGMKIDVDFLDGVPNSKVLRLKQFFYARLFGLYTTQRVPNLASKGVKAIAKIMLMVVSAPVLRDKIWMYAEKQMKKYPFDKSDYVRYMGSKLARREWYDKTLYVDFEGHKMPIPCGYDYLLRDEYGDYMTPPPVDKRIPITKVVFYDLNKSYKAYKGIYYCVKKR